MSYKVDHRKERDQEVAVAPSWQKSFFPLRACLHNKINKDGCNRYYNIAIKEASDEQNAS